MSVERVDAPEERVTARGDEPLVDVRPATHVAVLDRKTIDNPDSQPLNGTPTTVQGQLNPGVAQRLPDGPAACDATAERAR